MSLVSQLLPEATHRPDHWEALYPPRPLPEGAVVTRFAPSPTGHLHIGGVYVALIAQSVAHASGGTYFVRVEDTDQARSVAEARDQFDRSFAYFGIASDEPGDQVPWGPYEQSKRSDIYVTYARQLLEAGRAYPCFCTHEELERIRSQQQAANEPTGYYGRWAACATLTDDEVEAKQAAGLPFVIRFRPPADAPARIAYLDRIRGEIEQQNNSQHAVLLKSTEPRLPTYHLAHVIDDHLMRVTVVIRADEWIASVPLHLQLFAALGLAPPDYAHIAPLMKVAGASRRKLSKRKDPEASVSYYISEGYPADAVHHYLRGLANSDLADLPIGEAATRPIRLDHCGVAGPLVDLAKLEDIAQDAIAERSAEQVLAEVLAWARELDADLAATLEAEEQRAIAALRVGRDGERVRKDLNRWSRFRAVYGFFFDGLFEPVVDPADERFGGVDPAVVQALARDFADGYRSDVPADEWFDQVRVLANRHGFAANKAELRAKPEAYVGMLKDAAGVIRVLLTGSTRSPELDQVAAALGPDTVLRRARAVLPT